MSFQQTAAPTGWTKDTTAAINDSILRFVTGSVTPSGGSVAFSTWNAQTATGGTTLTIAQMPAHTHGYPETTTSGAAGASSGRPVSNFVTVQTQSTGGSGSHDHPLTQNIKFYDFIIAAKD
jgi:microcystin-dependent protein